MFRPVETREVGRTGPVWPESNGETARICCAIVSGAVVPVFASCCAGVCYAAGAVPADARVGVFYALTHLHPLAYFILFLVVVLSVLNLVIQGWLTRETWPLNRILHASGRTGMRLFRFSRNKRPLRTRPDSSVSIVQGGPEHLGGVIGAPRPVKMAAHEGNAHPPTPLDGVNHPIPRLENRMGTQTGAPRIVEHPAEKKALNQDFRFSATVDVPSAEELERREKEQLVVSGAVTGPDGRGVASSIVYLSDEEGNRIGQSCRSQADTGEFKVLVNQPGKYFLNVYKRGYVLENPDPMALPIESGKIEGFRVRMIPEGCAVQGRVTTQGGMRVVPEIMVTCLCKATDFSRAARTDLEGRFKISGIPINAECFLEVARQDGKIMVRSNTFETVQRKEIYQDLIIPLDQLESSSDQTAADQIADWSEKQVEEAPNAPATSAPA